MKIRVFKSKDWVKFQIGGLRFYISRVALTAKKKGKLGSRFRLNVLERDRVCAMCGTELDMYNLSIHHIKKASEHPELAKDPDNCIGLCVRCHRELHMHEAVHE